MRLVISPRVEKQLRKLPKVPQIAVVKKIRELPTLGVQQTQKLSVRGHQNIYRVRAGDYRVVYKKTSREVYIVLIGHRKDIYRRLKKLLG
jgi:mRNA interferase RelE/StbE